MSDVQEILARAAELAAGMTREEALEGLAEVCGTPHTIPVDVSGPGDEPAAAPEEEPEEEPGEDCPECGGRGWLDDPSDGGAMICDHCDGTGYDSGFE